MFIHVFFLFTDLDVAAVATPTRTNNPLDPHPIIDDVTSLPDEISYVTSPHPVIPPGNPSGAVEQPAAGGGVGGGTVKQAPAEGGRDGVDDDDVSRKRGKKEDRVYIGHDLGG